QMLDKCFVKDWLLFFKQQFQHSCLFFLMLSLSPSSTLFPYTTLFRSAQEAEVPLFDQVLQAEPFARIAAGDVDDQAEVGADHARSEEHTSELQSRSDLVCRLLLEKKNCNKLKYK